MVSQICAAPDIYQIQLVIPGVPAGIMNSYAIISKDQGLLIDLGIEREPCIHLSLDAAAQLGLAPENTRIFLTHCHGDHAGLAVRYARMGYQILTGDKEWNAYQSYVRAPDIEKREAFYASCGAPEWARQRLVDSGLSINLSTPEYPTELLSDGAQIQVGAYTLETVETPGHSVGHLCLYMPQQRILFSGDSIFLHHRPDVRDDYDRRGMLEIYFNSLKRLGKMPIELCLPAHGPALDDSVSHRTEELIQFHMKRIESIYDLVKQYPHSTCWELAFRIPRMLLINDPQDLEGHLLHAIVTECFGYLNYLIDHGAIRVEEQDGVMVYA